MCSLKTCPEADSFVEMAEAQLEWIGNRIKELRIKKGYKRRDEFAIDYEISRNQMYRFEKGKEMKLSTFIRLLACLDVSFEEFFEGYELKKQPKRKQPE